MQPTLLLNWRVSVNSATADKSEQESFDFAQDGSLDPFDSFDPSISLRAGYAPYFALNDRASDFAKVTPDKSQGKQDRFCGCFLNFVLWLFELVHSP